jgi:hypothetical protein
VRPRVHRPRLPTVAGHGRDQAVRAPVRPAVLLIDADDVGRVGRVDSHEGLDLGMGEVRSRWRARVIAVRARRERTWDRGVHGRIGRVGRGPGRRRDGGGDGSGQAAPQ